MLRSLFKPKPPTFIKESYAEFMRGRFSEPRRRGSDLEAEYHSRLPIVLLSRCPYCSKPLRYHFDAFSLSGSWWRGGINGHPPVSACKHFFVLEGAFNLNGNPPPEDVELSVEVGPDVPFVIPSFIHRMPAVAVIHKVIVAERHIGFPIGYFTTRSTAAYNRTHAGTPAWVVRRGWATETGYGVDFHGHDFELGPYIAAAQVRWLDPDDPEHSVRQGQPADCPYYNLPGHRKRQKISSNKVRLADSPRDDRDQPDPDRLLKDAGKSKP